MTLTSPEDRLSDHPSERDRLLRRALVLRELQEARDLRQRVRPRRTHEQRVRWLTRMQTFRRT